MSTYPYVSFALLRVIALLTNVRYQGRQSKQVLELQRLLWPLCGLFSTAFSLAPIYGVHPQHKHHRAGVMAPHQAALEIFI